MLVVDVETTGTEPSKHSIISIGALDFYHPSNTFYIECRAFEGAHIMKEALSINGCSMERVLDSSYMAEGEAVKIFMMWAKSCEMRTLTGHNVWFDKAFLKSAAERARLDWSFADRIIDVHSICFIHSLKRGIPPPLKNGHSGLNSKAVANYVGIPEEKRPHNALNGAKQAAEVLSRLLRDEPLFDEFRLYRVPWIN